MTGCPAGPPTPGTTADRGPRRPGAGLCHNGLHSPWKLMPEGGRPGHSFTPSHRGKGHRRLRQQQHEQPSSSPAAGIKRSPSPPQTPAWSPKCHPFNRVGPAACAGAPSRVSTARPEGKTSGLGGAWTPQAPPAQAGTASRGGLFLLRFLPAPRRRLGCFTAGKAHPQAGKRSVSLHC